MLPLQLILKNYTTFEDAVLDFRNIRKALILGIRNNDATSSNGAGKSNLLRAIPWCLWGINPEAKTLDQNVRWGADFCSVQFDFLHHKQHISVIRTRTPKTNKSTLDLIIDGVGSNGNSIADTTQKIINLLNLDYVSYVNSCYIRQNDIYSLANTEDKNQSRELFERLMGLTIYDEYYDATEVIVGQLEEERDELFAFINEQANLDANIEAENGNILAYQNGIVQKQLLIDTLKQALEVKQVEHDSMKEAIVSKEAMVREHVTAVASLKKSKSDFADLSSKSQNAEADYLNKVNALSLRIQEKQGIEQEMADWEEKIAVSKKTRSEIDELDFKIESKRGAAALDQKAVGRIETEVGILKHDGLRIKAEMDAMLAKLGNPNIAIGSKCDVCLTDITADTLDHYAGHLNSEISDKKSQISKLREKAMSLNPDKDMLLNSIAGYEQSIAADLVDKQRLSGLLVDDSAAAGIKKNLQRHLDDIASKQSELDKMDIQVTMKPWKDALAQKKQDIDNLQETVDKLATKVDMTFEQQQQKIAQIKSEIENDRHSISTTEREIYLANANIEMSKTKIGDFDIIKKKLVENQERLKKVEHDLVIYRDLLVAFSPKGIRYHILGKAIEELEREANQILPKLSQGNLKIRFETKKEIQKSKKGNQEKLVFEAFVNDGQKEQPFSSYSGGEQFRISFVIRVALSNLLLKRANADLQFLVIDEAISPLDQAGIEMIIPTINELQNFFKVILVITHRSEVKQYFDEVITIKRNKYTSNIVI